MFKGVASAAAAIAMTGAASAATLSDVDLTGLSFEIDSKQTSFTSTTITGTSNGIGFTYEGRNFEGLSTDNGTEAFVGLPGSYDALHVSGPSNSFTFDVPVFGFVFATENDSSQIITINFSELVDDVTGGLALANTGAGPLPGGTVYTQSFTGGTGLVVFTQALSGFSFSVDQSDGVDFAVFALTEPVPLPAAALLMGPVLAGFALRKKRRAA